MHGRFPQTLNLLREQAQLSNRELARLSNVPESLISGLQRGSRRVGEANARQIGEALGLTGTELNDFVLTAIDTSTRKLLRQAQGFPAAVLNFTATQLRQAGVTPELVTDFAIGSDDARVTLLLNDGRKARLEVCLSTT